MKKLKEHKQLIKWLLIIYFNNPIMNDRVDKKFDELILYCIKYGIKNYIKVDQHHFYILFNNEIILKGWDENKYYAWLTHNEIYYPYTPKEVYYNVRVKKSTMIKLLILIENYENGR